MLGFIFLASIFVFVIIILFFSWYYKAVTRRIYGRIYAVVNYVAAERKPPENWEKRKSVLNRALASGGSDRKKLRLLEKYMIYIESDARNLIMMAERAGFIPDEDARAEAVAALNCVRGEAVGECKALMEKYGGSELTGC